MSHLVLPLLVFVSSAFSDEFWMFPENPQFTNEGRLTGSFSKNQMELRSSGVPFGKNENNRFQILDNDLIRKKATKTQNDLRSPIDFSKFPGYEFVLTEGYQESDEQPVISNESDTPSNSLTNRATEYFHRARDFSSLSTPSGPKYQQIFLRIPDKGHSHLPHFFINRSKEINFHL